ncbi:hypothetical protein ADL01_31925 [Streptomyces sp. NRRL WC-3618]|nr:hypothetical protein ADL01_31925 [Streptomyces sp. NRRL WC-3618]
MTPMPTAVELLVRDAELLVVDDAREIPGGWVAVDGGRVTAVGAAGPSPRPARPCRRPDGASPRRDALTDHGRIARRMQAMA